MPRPKSDLTKSRKGKTVGARVTYWMYTEWKLLGGGTWLRQVLMEARWKRLGRDVETLKTHSDATHGTPSKE